jgi:voltage-gated potassium channel
MRSRPGDKRPTSLTWADCCLRETLRPMDDDRRRAATGYAARSALIVVALLVAYAALPFRGDRWWLGATVAALLLAATIPITFRRLRAVLVSDRPVLEAVAALVQLLTMLLVGFAAVYFAIDHAAGQFNGLSTRIDAMYFTVTTMSTVGFGDVNASGQAARVLVTIQIVFNVAFVGIAVRVFVGAAKDRAGRRPPKQT